MTNIAAKWGGSNWKERGTKPPKSLQSKSTIQQQKQKQRQKQQRQKNHPDHSISRRHSVFFLFLFQYLLLLTWLLTNEPPPPAILHSRGPWRAFPFCRRRIMLIIPVSLRNASVIPLSGIAMAIDHIKLNRIVFCV